MPLTGYLRDRNEEMVKAWSYFFGRNARVDIGVGDVFELDARVLVVPTNSFGIFSDGVAAQLNKLTNGQLESRVRKLIRDKYAGELPVGLSEIITTGLEKPFLAIIAPSMRVPAQMSTSVNVNSYLATRSALRTLAAYMRQEREQKGETQIDSVALVGMGAGAGKTAPAVSAFQMYEAYCQIVLG